MEIIALQEYTDKYISLYEGEIRNISTQLAQRLIEQGIVTEHGDKSNLSEDLFIISFNWQYNSELEDTKIICDKTFDEIKSFFAEYYNFETDVFTKKIIGYLVGSFSIRMGYNCSEIGQLIEIEFDFIEPSNNDYLSFSVITINENGIYQKLYNYEDAGLPAEKIQE